MDEQKNNVRVCSMFDKMVFDSTLVANRVSEIFVYLPICVNLSDGLNFIGCPFNI